MSWLLMMLLSPFGGASGLGWLYGQVVSCSDWLGMIFDRVEKAYWGIVTVIY